MLAPDERTILLDDLRPPVGARVEAVVATTFTLDLAAALLPPLALAAFPLGESRPDPVTLLQAVRANTDIVDIFCQAGAIRVPQKGADLVTMLEGMVHEVTAPAGGLFHPKLWLSRFRDDSGVASYRLLVLSRNITHDPTWDISVRLDSARVHDRPRTESRGLTDLLRWVTDHTVHALAQTRRERVLALADESRFIEWERPEAVDELSIHLLGPRRPSPDFTGRRHLVVAPFVDDAGLRLVAPDSPAVLVSRPETLAGLESIADLDVRVIRPDADLDSAANDSAQGIRSGLHAKFYVVEPGGREHRARLLLGSANATAAAFRRNIEILVEMGGRRRALGIDQFIGDGADFARLLVPYRPRPEDLDPEQDERWRMEGALRALAEMPHRVSVTSAAPDQPDVHTLRISAPRPYAASEHWQVTVALLTRPGNAVVAQPGLALDTEVTSIETADITAYLVVTLSSGHLSVSGVVLAELVGAPADRLDRVLARQLDTPEKFLRFLLLLLSLGNRHLLAHLAQLPGAAEGTPQTASGARPLPLGLLELLVRALHDHPSSLDEVARLLAVGVDSSVLPAGFADVWETITQARHLLGADDDE